MDWLINLAGNAEAPVLAALALGLLTAISPCPLATNITATAYIAKTIRSKGLVLLSGGLYTLGRMLSYTLLAAVIYFGASQFHIAKAFQSNGEKFIGPVMIVIGLIMLDVIKLRIGGKSDLSDELAERFKNKGLLGSFVLGALFALAFCPYSGALFFGMLMPLMLGAEAGLAVPLVFAAGTGLPVMAFAFVIAYSMQKLALYFKRVQQVERVMRILAGIVFILTGLYYIGLLLKVI
ncbi:MAG: aromatic aminobenezylarsenical efflux permease ArsG family transporter [Chitinophagaceae bacterium]|nr:aromatic aminobenezylarsenical efflux permease ArsG family transporter [Chitinophagaceae bacterium]